MTKIGVKESASNSVQSSRSKIYFYFQTLKKYDSIFKAMFVLLFLGVWVK
jgi:hypothetical protein